VDNTIAIDDETVSQIIEKRVLEPWFEWKKGLEEKHGLAFSVDYSLAWLGANDSPDVGPTCIGAKGGAREGGGGGEGVGPQRLPSGSTSSLQGLDPRGLDGALGGETGDGLTAG
jgi:hypothetical protein